MYREESQASGTGKRGHGRERGRGGSRKESIDPSSCDRGGPKNASGGVTPARNQQPQGQDPTPEQARRFTGRIGTQGREGRGTNGDEGGGRLTRKNTPKNYRDEVGKGMRGKGD